MIGEKISNYEINAHLGQGGMGNVFRATDSMLGREVALKMLHPQLTVQSQFLDRFKKEARVLARLLHPNIAVIYNFIEQGGNHFMVMEYVEGTTLDEMLKKYGPLPPKLIVPIVVQALEGLQHAHTKQILHRDIKPSNLMLTPDGTLKLMDFGIAKVAGEQKMTQVNKIVGTVEFMAPELIEGKQASNASDIYAMGVTLYELLSGKLPFESDTDYNLMQTILKQKVKALDKLNPSIPKALSDIVSKAMEKNPENRFPDARAFQQALITAFPSYRDIDVKIVEKSKPTLFINQPDPTASARNDQYKGTALSNALETKTDSSLSAGPLLTLKEYGKKAITKKRLPYILAGIGALFFILMFISSLSSRSSMPDAKDKSTLLAADTVKPTAPRQENLVAKNSVETIEPTQIPPVKTGGEDQPASKDPAPAPAKRKKKKIEEAGSQESAEQQPVVVRQPEKKEIYIDSRVEVKLYMEGNFEESEREKDHPVTFTVSSPVVYNGVTIIRQGAVAKGSISIGRMITAVQIYSVTGANGQQLAFRSANFRRKRRDLSSDRNYDATLEQGIRMIF